MTLYDKTPCSVHDIDVPHLHIYSIYVGVHHQIFGRSAWVVQFFCSYYADSSYNVIKVNHNGNGFIQITYRI